MPEHPTRGRGRRGLAIALMVPAAAVAAIFTAASVATGTTGSPAAQPGPTDNVGGVPSQIAPPTGGTTGAPGTAAPTGTATRSPTATRTTTPGVAPAVPTGTTGTAATCVSGTATASPTRTGTGVAPGTTGATGTRTATGTPTAPAPTRTPTGGATVDVPGAAEQPATGTPTATRTSPTATSPSVAHTTIKLGTAGGKSNVLVDHNGCALYLNTNDTSSQTDVNQDAEKTWIPVPAPAQVSGTGLDQAKVGTFTRPDGERQATYNGHQLYRFAGDRAPGEAKGQGVDGEFFLVGQNGEAVR